MTSLTTLSLVVIVTAALTRKYYWVALGVGGGTPIGATLIFGNDAIPTFYAAAIGAAVGLGIRMTAHLGTPLGGRVRSFPAALPLLIFTVWCIVITMASPILFAGTTVFLGPNRDSISQISGTMTTSNIAQIVYLLLGVAVIFFLAGSSALRPDVVLLAAGLVTVLSFWKLMNDLTGLPFPTGLFDNNTTYAFIDTLPGGAPRFRGILSEPAGLATSSIVVIAYALSRAAQLRGAPRVLVLVLAGMAAYMASISTSTTFVLVITVLAVAATLLFLRRQLRRQGRGRIVGALVLCALIAASFYALPLVVELLTQVVREKLGTASYADRTISDNRGYAIFLEKFPLGVGLGSNRSGSFLAFLLGTTGLVGVMFFAWVLWASVRPVIHVAAVRPVIWALAGLLLVKLISAPDLADSSGVLFLTLGALAYQCRRERLSAAEPWLRRPRDSRSAAPSARARPRPGAAIDRTRPA